MGDLFRVFWRFSARGAKKRHKNLKKKLKKGQVRRHVGLLFHFSFSAP
jgi:hypothetical protein